VKAAKGSLNHNAKNILPHVETGNGRAVRHIMYDVSKAEIFFN
jgi:hypothetical protein